MPNCSLNSLDEVWFSLCVLGRIVQDASPSWQPYNQQIDIFTNNSVT